MSHKILRSGLPLLAGLLLFGCAQEQLGKSLPLDRFQFPTGLAVHPAGFALVASSNFDLAYVNGSLRVIDLNMLADELTRPADQRPEFFEDTILTDQGIGLDNFAGSVAISGDGTLAAVTSRERDEVMLLDLGVEVDGQGKASLVVSCWPGGIRPDGSFPKCAGARNRLRSDEPDPFEVLFLEGDETEGEPLETLWVSALQSTRVTGYEIPADRLEVPQVFASLKTGSANNGDLAYGPGSGLLYVTTRYAALNTNPLHFFDPWLGDDAVMMGQDFFPDFLGNETRSIAFASDGLTAGVVVRSPDMLVLMDTSLEYTGKPANAFLGSVSLSANPSRVRALGDLMFVTGAQDDSVYLIDARARRLVERREDICRGPYDVAFWDRGDLQWALISCFEDDTVAVLDVRPDSPDYLEVLARVGQPRKQG